MGEHTSKEFTVDFGKIARTLDYADSDGALTFTFDFNSKLGDNALFLEISDDDDRSSAEQRYDMAVSRTKQFLESCGYRVEISDPRLFDREGWEAEIARNRAEAIASGRLTMTPSTDSVQDEPSTTSWWRSLVEKIMGRGWPR